MRTLVRIPMRTLVAAGLLVVAFDATTLRAQQSGAPPVPPAQPPVGAAARPKPAPTPDPVARPARATAPRATAPRATSPGSLGELDAIGDELRSGLTFARAYAPAALPELNVNLSEFTAAAAQMGQLAGVDGARAAMDGQRAAMEGMRAAMDGQRAAIEAQVATTIGGSFGFGQSSGGLTYAGSSAFRSQAPASWAPQDAADSLYREARRQLSNDNYPLAAMAFRKIREQYPKSAYAPDSYYWEAFAMQRIGQKASLNGALELLEAQQEKYPKASTRSDAAALRTRVEGQLARLGDQQAIASLSDRARFATNDGCPREQDDERIDALNAVAQIDADKAMPILKKVLARREPCTQRLRKTAVWLVASKKPADAADVLLNVAKTDPDKDVREQAVFWMANVPTEEATTMLIELAKKGDDVDLRKRAIYSLSRSKSPRATATLKDIALDANADVDVRGDALTWYVQGPGRTADDAMTFLKDVYGRADDIRFKQRVLQTISTRRSDDSRAFLLELAQNNKESIELRRSALWSLQGTGVTNAQMAQLYDRSTEVELRKQVIAVLGGMRDNGGVDKLLEIGRNEKNPELRKTAITYLSRSKDPRVIELLSEIINK